MSYNINPLKNIYNHLYLHLPNASSWKKIQSLSIEEKVSEFAEDMNLHHPTPEQKRDLKVRLLTEYSKLVEKEKSEGSKQQPLKDPALLSMAVANAQRKLSIQLVSDERVISDKDSEFANKKKAFIDTLPSTYDIEKVGYRNFMTYPAFMHLAKKIDEDMKKNLTLKEFAKLISLDYKADIQLALSNAKISPGADTINDAALALTLLQKNEKFNGYLQQLMSYLEQNKDKPFYGFVTAACNNYQSGINFLQH